MAGHMHRVTGRVDLRFGSAKSTDGEAENPAMKDALWQFMGMANTSQPTRVEFGCQNQELMELYHTKEFARPYILCHCKLDGYFVK